MTFAQALRVIQTQAKTMDQLNQVYAAAKQAQTNIQQSAASQFVIGDAVKFDSKRGVVNGIIQKVNRKTIKVKDAKNNVLWSVSPSLLKLA